jgi:hypothetical protein
MFLASSSNQAQETAEVAAAAAAVLSAGLMRIEPVDDTASKYPIQAEMQRVE